MAVSHVAGPQGSLHVTVATSQIKLDGQHVSPQGVPVPQVVTQVPVLVWQVWSFLQQVVLQQNSDVVEHVPPPHWFGMLFWTQVSGGRVQLMHLGDWQSAFVVQQFRSRAALH